MAVAFVMVFPSLLTPAYREKTAAANGGVICGGWNVKFCTGAWRDVKFGGFAVKFGLAGGSSCGRMGTCLWGDCPRVGNPFDLR